MSTAHMNLFDLRPEQLKRAASIKERIDGLNKQLRDILGVPAVSRVAPTSNRTMSPSVKKKIAATQKARWAKVKGAAAPAKAAKKKGGISAEGRAKLAAMMKARWAARRKAAKK